MNLQEKFKDNWNRKFAAKPGLVLLAVSGGLDSMVMAHLFAGLSIHVAVANCNFRLRGQESDDDEIFVRDWCVKNNIRFFGTSFDTLASSKAMGKGIQETARNLRYEWFTSIAKENDCKVVCTAHHADDNAETMLMNLCRGTGIAGLHGIPERNGIVIRPLLFATRAELNEYATIYHILHREDSSNAKDTYLRNAIRHHLIPELEKWMPGSTLRMLETARHIGEAETIYQQEIVRIHKKLLQQRGKDFYIPIKLLKHYQPLATILYELLQPFQFTTGQIPFACAIMNAESGKQLRSPTHRLIRNRDFLIITSIDQPNSDFIIIEEGTKHLVVEDARFEFSYQKPVPKDLNNSASVAKIDLAKIEPPLVLRRRKSGDYLYPLGMGMKKKKLSKVLNDLKIAAHEKDAIWVLESNKKIVWIAGIRLDERFKITPGTQQMLEVKFTRNYREDALIAE